WGGRHGHAGRLCVERGRAGRCRNTAGPDRLSRLQGVPRTGNGHGPAHGAVVAEPQYLAGNDVELKARVVDQVPPDSAKLFVRPAPAGSYRQLWMRPAGGYDFTTSIPSTALHNGLYQFVITVYHGDSITTFPGATPGKPTDWN